jgi:hypothetical protein
MTSTCYAARYVYNRMMCNWRQTTKCGPDWRLFSAAPRVSGRAAWIPWLAALHPWALSLACPFPSFTTHDLSPQPTHDTARRHANCGKRLSA